MKRVVFGIVLGVIGMAWLSGCQSAAPIATSVVKADAAAIAGYERGRGCYILMWCAHCNDGAGEYVRQYIPCDDLRDAYNPTEGEWVIPDSLLP